MILQPGDRVHFPGDSNDLGTILPHDRRRDHAFVIVWDRREADCAMYDVDECSPEGELETGYPVGSTTHEGLLVLVDRPSSPALARARVSSALARLAAGERLEELRWSRQAVVTGQHGGS